MKPSMQSVREAIVLWAWAGTWASESPEEAFEHAECMLMPSLESDEALDELVVELCDRHSCTFDWDDVHLVRAYTRELLKGPELDPKIERALRTLAQQEHSQ